MARRVFLTVLLLFASCLSQSAVNIGGSTNGCLVYGTGLQISQVVPFTMGYWHKRTSSTLVGYGIYVPNTIAQLFGSTAYCATPQMVFNVPASFNLCGTLVPSTNVWVFDATVVNAAGTSVHFFQMTASGTVTTHDAAHAVGNRNSTQNPILGGNGSACAEPLQGAIANAFLFNNVALTDAELKAVAYNGAMAVGHPVLAYWPLYFSNAPGVPIYVGGSKGSNGNNGSTGAYVVNLHASGTAGSVNHPPVGDPF